MSVSGKRYFFVFCGILALFVACVLGGGWNAYSDMLAEGGGAGRLAALGDDLPDLQEMEPVAHR